MQQNIFQHKDFYLCAYLIVQNCQLIKHERNGNSTTFTFLDSAELQNFVTDYYNMKGYVEPTKYSAVIKQLKSMIHSDRTADKTTLTTSSRNLNHEFSNNHGDKL